MSPLKQTGCIYIVKNIINNKYYVGQTRLRNPICRWKEHLDDACNRKTNLRFYRAIRKYGIENFVFQVIETNIPLELLDDKEKEYIIKFDSFEHGYNETRGGQDPCHSKLKKEQVLEIIEKIKRNEKTFVEIAKEYDVNCSTISDINNGDTWNFDGITYPILNKCNKKGLSESEVDDIYAKLKNGEKISSIAYEYNISKTMVHNINNGLAHPRIDTNYPIRKTYVGSKKMEINTLNTIVDLLQNTKMSYAKIGDKLNLSHKTISNINKGIHNKDILMQIGIEHFPIRK